MSRLLDNDLNAREAARAAHHLSDCADCRRHQDEAQSVRAALRALSAPEQGIANGSLRMRERAFARLEAQVFSGEKARTPHRQSWLHWPAPAWQPALATVAAAAVIIGGALLAPSPQTLQVSPPASQEMMRLYHLHDVQAADVAVGDPVSRHDARAEAQAALLDEADNNVQGNL